MAASYYDDRPSIPELIRRLERRVQALETMVHEQDRSDAAEAGLDQRCQVTASNAQGPKKISVVLDTEACAHLCRYAAVHHRT